MNKISGKLITFHPYLKPVIWGGNNICKYKGLEEKSEKIGESWEISAVPGYESIVDDGEYKGKTITELVETFGESLIGTKVMKKYGKQFPLLIKFIDAHDNLSVQVHPNDKLAQERHHESGKTEMWYVISTAPGSKIYSGFNRKLTPEDYVERVNKGNFEEVVAEYESKPGDVFFIPSGRVHAIGSGNLLTEIQQSSNITYRIYDYDRKDSNGNPRELHTEQAKEAIDYEDYNSYYTQSSNEELTELASCEHFNTHKLLLKGKKELVLDGTTFNVLICVDGKVNVKSEEGEIELQRGRTALAPASIGKIHLEGEATLLVSQV